MRKLKLDVHTLRVESFEPHAGPAVLIGTVRANGDEPVDPSGDESCAVTACLTCLCPHSSPQPSCDPCSWWEACLSMEISCTDPAC